LSYSCGFALLRDEWNDFLNPRDRLGCEPVPTFLQVLRPPGYREALAALPGLAPGATIGGPE
jgi:hypothetical protein